MIFDPNLVTPEGEATLAEIRKVARRRRKDTQAVAQRFVLERVISRLFDSPHADRFVLKGGMIFMFAEEVDALDARSTSDIDIHIPGYDGTVGELDAVMREVLGAAGGRDGIQFDLGGLEVLSKREGFVAGASVTFAAQIGHLRLKLHCDVGFDERPAYDVSVTQEMPSILPDRFAPIPVRRIPFSWTLADKVQCLVRHGENTTRFRDYYDLYVIASKGKADPLQAARALILTFDLFGSELPEGVWDIGALSDGFVARNETNWAKECRKRAFAVEVPDLGHVVRTLRRELAHLLELAHSLREGPRPAP